MVRVAALAALVAVLAVPAAAGELEDLRAENAKLKAQVAQLEKDLDAARNPKKDLRHFKSVAELWDTLPRDLRRGPWSEQKVKIATLAMSKEAKGNTLTVRGRMVKLFVGKDVLCVKIDGGRARVDAQCDPAKQAGDAVRWKAGQTMTATGTIDQVVIENAAPRGLGLYVNLLDAIVK